MLEKFNNELSPELKCLVDEKALDIASSSGRECICPKDLILCFLNEDIPVVNKIIEKLNINKDEMLKNVLSIPVASKILSKTRGLDVNSTFILQSADRLVSYYEHPFIGVEHVFLAFVQYGGRNKSIKEIKDILNKHGITGPKIKKEIINEKKDSYNLLKEIFKEGNGGKTTPSPDSISKMMTGLINCGYIEDLNEKMRISEEKFIGRDDEIARCIRILSRKKKRNAIIVGEPGTGKTAMVEGLARKIVEGNVPEKFKKTKVISLNMGNVISGTKYRGQFEERMRNILTFIEKASETENKTIMFIDEIHTLINTGSAEGSVNASTMIKPLLAKGSVQCIGATTWEDYRKTFLKDEALARRFSNIFLDEPSTKETVEILSNVKDEYEKFHSIKIDLKTIEETVNVSERFLVSRKFPDKAFDVLDEACAKDSMENGNEKLKISTVHEIISEMSGIPITTICGKEKEALSTMNENMKKIVIGQDEAVDIVCDSVKRARIGIKDPNQPIGVYLFLGPTGTGKTHLSKKLSQILFGKEKVIRLDMSEYMDKISVNKITGSPPGYVGYDEGSKIGEEIRKHPYSVLLLDEIEKAHSDVLNIFLQIFDEGRLTDSIGRVVDFRNTIIIMTSNLSTDGIEKRKTVGFNSQDALTGDEINKFLKKKAGEYFSPEFMNRIDSVVIFNKISKEDLVKIFDIEIEETKKRIESIGYPLEISESAKQFICEKGYSDKHGARPMKRAIKQYIETPIATKIVLEEIVKDNIVYIDVDGDNITICNKS